MSHYESDYRDASADLVEYYGQPISYQDSSLGSAAQLNGQVHPEKRVRRKNDYGWYWVFTRTVKVLDSELSDNSISEIRSDGTVTVGSINYSIEGTELLPGERTAILLTRASLGEAGRPDYRGR